VRDVFINNKVNTIVGDKLDVNRISGERDLTFTTVNNFRQAFLGDVVDKFGVKSFVPLQKRFANADRNVEEFHDTRELRTSLRLGNHTIDLITRPKKNLIRNTTRCPIEASSKISIYRKIGNINYFPRKIPQLIVRLRSRGN